LVGKYTHNDIYFSATIFRLEKFQYFWDVSQNLRAKTTIF